MEALSARLWALSDLHVRDPRNRRELAGLRSRPGDTLLVAGDVGESVSDLDWALALLTERFKKVVWVPGNHELWTSPSQPLALRGEAKYHALVEACRARGVLTPDDPYEEWPAPGSGRYLVPLFLLYDYSFRPDDVPFEQAVDWARESDVVCVDEEVLHPEPYPSRQDWCAARCELSLRRLQALPEGCRTVLVNHFPLRRSHAWLPLVPRFCIWCGTRRTDDWHRRFRAEVVVTGHLHLRSTRWEDGVRFEEVSLGYARQWQTERGIDAYLREVLPGPPPQPDGAWRYFR